MEGLNRDATDSDSKAIVIWVDDRWNLLGNIRANEKNMALFSALRQIKDSAAESPDVTEIYTADLNDMMMEPYILLVGCPSLKDTDIVSAQKRLEKIYLNCLLKSDDQGCSSVTFVSFIPDEQVQQEAWSVAQAIANALKEFVNSRASVTLKYVELLCESMLEADILIAVFNQLLNDVPVCDLEVEHNEAESPKADSDNTADRNAGKQQSSDVTEWYEIDCVLRRKKQAGKDLFLVRWKDSGQESWVKRKDLSPAAIQQFYASHPKRRRRRVR